MTWKRMSPGRYRSGRWTIFRHEHGFCLFHDKRPLADCDPVPTLKEAQALAEKKGEAHRRAVRAYQQRHRARGLCVQCTRPAVSASLCATHLRATRDRGRPPGSRPKRCRLCGELGHNRRTCRARNGAGSA